MGKKLESSFKNMVLVLFLVTLVSSAAVGVVNSLTSGLIEKVKIEKQVQAIRAVVPAFDNDPMTEKQIVKVDGGMQFGRMCRNIAVVPRAPAATLAAT